MRHRLRDEHVSLLRRNGLSTSAQKARILQEVQRTLDSQADQAATWLLSFLRKALRATDLPHIANETIRQVLHTSAIRGHASGAAPATSYANAKAAR